MGWVINAGRALFSTLRRPLRMYSKDVRWLVIYRRVVLHHPDYVVCDDLGPTPTTQNTWLKLFNKNGEPFERRANQKSRRGEARSLATALEDVRLLELLRERPSNTHGENAAILMLEGR